MGWAEANRGIGRREAGLRLLAALWRRERPLLLALLAAGIAGAAATSWLVGAVRADIASGLQMPEPSPRIATPEPARPEPMPEPLTPVSTGSHFPANGSVVWHYDGIDDAGAFDGPATELALADDSRGHNHVLRFHRGGRLVASLHLAEGSRARIYLPRGVYGVELVSRPVGADYESAFGPGARGRFLRSIDLTRPNSAYRLGPMLLITEARRTIYVPGVRAGRRT